jgi:23S rRNA maturation mini-RNase III
MLKSKKVNGGYANDLLSVDGDTFFCVAIGSAIGGFDALKELITSLPNALTTVSFFVAQPIEDEKFNTLVANLPAGSALSIRRARQLEAIQAGIIYTIVPDESMELTPDGCIKILPLQTAEAGSISDTLFQSLAIYNGQKSIAIVLSGTGSDGAAGIKFVHHAGGKVLVQTPQTANYNGMPLAAIATECVNEILPVYKMGNALQKIYLHSIASQKNHAAKSLHKSDGDISFAMPAQPALKEKQTQSLPKSSIETMVKDAIFNSYHHTYIVLDNKNTITEINGDTAMYFNANSSGCINQNIWKVLKETFKQEVHTAFTNTLAGQQLAAATVKAISLQGRLILIRILVKLLGARDNISSQCVIILEKIDTNQLINTNIIGANKAESELVMKKLALQIQPVR